MTGYELALCVFIVKQAAFIQFAPGAATTPDYVFEAICLAEDRDVFVGTRWGSERMKKRAQEVLGMETDAEEYEHAFIKEEE